MRSSLFTSLVSMMAPTLSGLDSSPDTLRVSAIVGKGGVSQLECWSLLPGFNVSTQPGTVGSKQLQLGLIANGSFTVFPTPGPIDAGLHNAPNSQWVITLSGSGKVTFPNKTDQSLELPPGSIAIAVDTPGTSEFGHRTVWEGGSQTIQLPFQDGFIPPHNASPGACN